MLSRDAAPSKSTKPIGAHIIDQEFGVIVCRRSAKARFVRIRVTEQGVIRASLPNRAPLYMVRELLESSRQDIRELVQKQKSKRVPYRDGMRIGHSHTLRIAFDDIDQPKSLIKEQVVSITAPNGYQRDTDQLHHYISQQIRRALRREAMAYLPRRLSHLAQSYGFEYARERFGNQSGRWGSCSTSGTISLNVALMNLPLELIDYVLLHELAHTKQMNHSPAFWDIVEECMPEYRQHRKILKTMSPIC